MIKRNKQSIAIIGEGETEWFYINALRVALRYPFTIAPDFPKHSDVLHLSDMISRCLSRGFDYGVCLIDMDRLLTNEVEMHRYRKMQKEYAKTKYKNQVFLFESNPCTEFWFLLHFIPTPPQKEYSCQDEVITELQHYLPGNEKTKKYFVRSNFSDEITSKSNIDQAIANAEKLIEQIDWSISDKLAYTHIHKLFHLLNSLKR